MAAAATGSDRIDLSWDPSTDNIGVTGYRIERCQGTGCTGFAQIASVTTTTHADTGLIAATSYSYRVRAFDAATNLSLYSPVASATTDAPPPPPPPPDTTAPSQPSALTAVTAGSVAVNLSWVASTDNIGVTGYRVERCQGAICSNFAEIATPTATSLSDSGLSAATSYRYRVRARDAAGNLSAYSQVASATTDAAPPPQVDAVPPSQPIGLAAAADGPFGISLTWQASTDNVGVTGYRVERCQGAGCTGFAQIASPTTTSFADSGLTPATTYRYRLRAVDAATNSSDYSAIANATTGTAPPPPPPGTLPSWVSVLVPGQWYEIPGTALSSVTPSPEPVGNTGPRSKVIAWTSFVVDTRTSKVYSVANGGHLDYSGNEVSVLDLERQSPLWIAQLAPTPPDQVTLCQPYYRDGRPASRHTYYGVTLNPFEDRIMLLAGALWCGNGDWTKTVSSYNIGTNTYSPSSSHPNVPSDFPIGVPATAVDPQTGDVYTARNFVLARWRRSTNSWAILSPSGSPAAGDESPAAFDTSRNRMLILRPGNDRLYSPASNAWTNVTLTGPNAQDASGGGGALVYVEAIDRFLVRRAGSGGTVYQIHPSTFEVSTFSPFGSAAIPSTVNGPYNKFLYVPRLRGAVYVPSYTGNAWFLRIH